MIATIPLDGKQYKVNFAQPLDISIPLHPNGPRAWYAGPMRIAPVRTDRFTGSVAEGGAVNFRDIWFNPHAHGTHTETSGHIDREVKSINKTLKQFMWLAQVISITPEVYGGTATHEMQPGDLVVTRENLDAVLPEHSMEQALVVRTLPNSDSKLDCNYSNTNPPYFDAAALTHIRSLGVRHLLTDLPSVDRESDGGALLAHRAFWRSGFPGDADCTITEMVFVPDEVPDGLYLLNLQIAPFENDASPSKPVLYAIEAAH